MHDYIYKRKVRNRADLSAAGPLLERAVEHRRRDDFFSRLSPHLRFLRDHARRELRMLEQNGTLHRRELTVDDLLDDVMILAWERFVDRPRHLSLDLWLTNLLHETLERWIKQEPRPHVSLQADAREFLPDQAFREGEEEPWVELLGDEEHLRLEDLIPDAEGTEAWERLDADEQRDRLLSLIGELPPAQRQAFLLYALENYETAEIAMLQGRPESQVKADIKTARKALRERLLAGGLLKNGARPEDELRKATGP
jgi:RNA polymerase sigma factor (sigma-70 family)